MIVYLYKKKKNKSRALNAAKSKPQQLGTIKTREVPLGNPVEETGSSEKIRTDDATATATSIRSNDRTQRCQEDEPHAKSARRRYRWKIILGLMPAFFLGSLDLTIVATALPFIASHFNRLNQLNWIVTAFTLTSTAFIPAWGQLADTLGRHTAVQAAVVFMLLGSTLGAAAVNWPMLLLGRALQGISAAGIQNLTMIILADNVSLKEQAKNTSIFQLVNGLGYSVGPVIGGYLTNASWRWVFIFGIPLALLSNLTIFFLLRKELKPAIRTPLSAGQSRTQSTIDSFRVLDYGGMVLFTLGTGLIILGTAWGGSTFSWTSPAVLVSLVVGIILFVTFFVWEYLLEPGRVLSRAMPHTKAMLPFHLFRRHDVGLIAFIGAATGTGLYSVFYFIGIYFTLVEAYPASRAGIQLLYYVPGIGVGVYGAIVLCNFRPRQTFWPLFTGTIIETAGLAVVTYAVKARASTLVNVMMAIAGVGTGIRMMPMNLHLAGVWPDQIASVYSILRFALPFGGTLALTIMGSVFQNKMATFFGSPAVQRTNGGGSGQFNLHSQAALQAINQLPAAEQKVIRQAGANATMWAFVSILPILALAVLAGAFLGNVWIAPPKNNTMAAAARDGEVLGDTATPAGTRLGGERDQGPGTEVLDSIYLLALMRGRIKLEKRVNPPPVGRVRQADTADSGDEQKKIERSGSVV